MSNRPLVTKDQIVAYLRLTCNELNPIVEVSDIYPSNDEVVAYGVYVGDVDYESREPYQLGIQKSGSIYIASDTIDIMYVSYQNDNQRELVEDRIYDLASDSGFFDGYHEVTFTEDTVLGNSKSRRTTFTFNLNRLNFND
jgi:hypothetical protein